MFMLFVNTTHKSGANVHLGLDLHPALLLFIIVTHKWQIRTSQPIKVIYGFMGDYLW